MAKIMIVEDDRNLLSIYGDRLKAEGHEIITASDGEEALAVAVKEKPDLIISDVMMPKVSGFDMLDILRSTPETKEVKIVMMTALSQAEDRERANKLGADKYLVKTQVTLDDVARTVNEMVSGGSTPKSSDTTAPDAPAPVAQPAVAPDPIADATKTVDEEEAKISAQIDDFLSKNMPDTPAPASVPVSVPAQPAAPTNSDVVTPGAHKPDIFELYEKEIAKEAEQAQAPKSSDAEPKS